MTQLTVVGIQVEVVSSASRGLSRETAVRMPANLDQKEISRKSLKFCVQRLGPQVRFDPEVEVHVDTIRMQISVLSVAASEQGALDDRPPRERK